VPWGTLALRHPLAKALQGILKMTSKYRQDLRATQESVFGGRRAGRRVPSRATRRTPWPIGSVVACLAACACPAFAQQPSPGSNALAEVTVTASKLDLTLGQMTQPATVITQADIQSQAQVDMTDVLRQTPGIQFEQGDVPGQFLYPRLRGFSDSTLYVFDGITMNEGSTGDISFLLGQLDPSMVQRIEVLRGPRATLYGANTISGVIDFTSLTGDHPQTDVSVEAGSVDWKKIRAGTQNAVAVGDGTWSYSLNASYLDSAGEIEYEYVKNATLVGRTSYRSGDFEFGVSFFGTDNRFQNALQLDSIPGATQANYFAVQIPDASDVDQTKAGIASVWLEDQLSSSLSQKLTLGLTTQDFSITNGDYANGGYIGSYVAPYNGWTDPNTYSVYNAGQTVPVYQFSQGTYRTINNNKEADYNLRYHADSIAAVLGATYIGQTYDEGGIYGSLHEDQTIKSVYADASIGWLANKLHTEFGARLDSYSAWRNKATYSAGAVYDIVPGFSLYANYGTSFTQPTLDQLYNPTYGSKTLTPENGSTVEGGVRAQQFEGRLKETLTWWHSYVDNVIIYDYNIYNPLVPGDFGRYANVEAERSQGLETELAYRITPSLTLTGNYTYTDSQVTNSAGLWNLQILNARNLGNLGLQYQVGRLDVGTNLFMTSRRLRYAGDVWAPGYARLDLFGRFHVTGQLDLYVRVQNALDHDIVEVLGYKNPGVFAVGGASYRF
jgi:vitamin B12 transporter